MRFVLASVLLLAAIQPSVAETCHEKFVRLFTERNGKGPVKIHVTQEIKGGPTTTNYNYQNGTGHWMTEAIEPANMPWSLVYDNTMFASSDRGKTWVRIRKLDSQQRAGDVEKDLQDTVATVKNAACGSQDLDGVAHETVAADYAYPKYNSEHRDTYWVNPATGWIAKSTTETRQAGFESSTTQLMEPAPGLLLPTPSH